MPSCHASAKSLLARLRGPFGRRSRALAAGILLLLMPMAIPPEEIEEHIRSMSNAEIVQILERKQQPPGDPPGEDELGLPRGLEQQ
jgi:hypothetical protein